MKKLIILCIVSFLFGSFSNAQGTVDVMLENPRIITVGGIDYFYFDVYGKKTSSWGNGSAAEQAIQRASFYFTWNNTDGSNPSLVTYNTTVFPVGIYNVTLGTTGASNFKLYVDVTPVAGPLFEWVQDDYYFLFTVRFQTNGSTNLSNLSWLFPDTGLTHFRSFTAGISLAETSITSGVDIALDYKSWSGSSSGDWNNVSNWSPSGLPIATDDVIYPNNPTNELSVFNTIAAHKLGEVNNLRINHFGEMHILANMGLTVNGTTSLYGDTNLVLDASTTPISDSIYSSAFIPKGGINYSAYSIEDGHIEVHRTLDFASTASGYYMHQVAAPVSGVLLDDWDMAVLNTYAFEWRTASQTWYNIYAPSRSTPPGYGFVISLGGQGASTRDLVFTDNLVLTDQVINFDAIAFGENALIGNPYVAPIDWDLMLVGQSNISTTCYVWNPLGDSYVTYVAGTGGHLAAKRIQPGQSFFIDATGPVSSFSIDLADRVAYVEPYMKEGGYPYLLNLSTEGGNGSSEEIYIRFKEDEGVTPAYDQVHDGKHKLSEHINFATELYTVTSDGVDLAVDARPMLVGDDVSVPLHFKPIEDDTYRIVADEASMNTFPESISIMLEDTFEPQQDWIDMRAEGYYEFDADKYDPKDRFIVHFYDLEFGIEDGVVEPIRIFSDRTDAFIINESEQLIKEIHVYDITGNLITSKSTVNNASTRIFVSNEVGYYIVKVITDKAVYSEKVLITK